MLVLSPLHAFSSLFRCQLWSAGKRNIKKLEILPLLHIEMAKSAEPWNETIIGVLQLVQQIKAGPRRHFEGRDNGLTIAVT